MRNFALVLVITTIMGFLIGMFFFNIPQISAIQKDETSSFGLLIDNQKVGSPWLNPMKYVVHGVVASGISPKTVSLLLLLTVVTAFIAGIRHLVGVQSFGLFLPAALSVVFVSIGPVFGVIFFILIIGVATIVRFSLRKGKIHLQYLPRMAFILWAVVICVLIILFLGPLFGGIDFSNISVLPLFILILLAEDFIRVQLGKSIKTAINITTETLVIAFLSYLILSFMPFEQFALLNPEILLISVAVFDFILGKYSGLRFFEFWRFRKLIKA
jgi:hypothetical protein